jgi:hypothetical protein
MRYNKKKLQWRMKIEEKCSEMARILDDKRMLGYFVCVCIVAPPKKERICNLVCTGI